MGNQTFTIKQGRLYIDIRQTIRPLDIFFFNGNGLVADLVKFAEERRLTPSTGEASPTTYSHVGIIVTSEILNHPRVQPGRLYLWNATMSGSSCYGVKNIDGETFFGVQLQSLDELIVAYDKPNDTSIAVGYLTDEVRRHVFGGEDPENITYKDAFKTKFTILFNELNGITYNYNPYSLLASIFPFLRPERKKVENILGTSQWLFCSELVALVFKRLDIVDKTVDIQNILPMDLLGYKSPGVTFQMPTLVTLPLASVTTSPHYKPPTI
jgi:hypothetical protein